MHTHAVKKIIKATTVQSTKQTSLSWELPDVGFDVHHSNHCEFSKYQIYDATASATHTFISNKETLTIIALMRKYTFTHHQKHLCVGAVYVFVATLNLWKLRACTLPLFIVFETNASA